MGEAPTLVTERLILRGHGVADFDDSAAMWADREVVRYIGGKPFTRSEVWARLLRYAGHWKLLGYGFWVVREKASERFVGEVGFLEAKRAIEPSFGGAPEVGWALSTSAHGRGFATEAVSAAIAWGDEHFDGARTVCMIEPENAASIRVAAKLGFVAFAHTKYDGVPIDLYERVATNRSARRSSG